MESKKIKNILENKQGIIEQIKWKLYLWKLGLFCNKLEMHHKAMRRKYCRKGFHKLSTSYYGSKKSGKKWVHIHFLKCIHCNYMFFTTKKQKELYLKEHGTDKDSFSAFLKSLSSLKAKRLEESAGSKRKDVSSSGDKHGKKKYNKKS